MELNILIIGRNQQVIDILVIELQRYDRQILGTIDIDRVEALSYHSPELTFASIAKGLTPFSSRLPN